MKMNRICATSRPAMRCGHLARGVLVWVGALTALLALPASFGSTSAQTPQANVWVDGNGGSCTRQASAGTYSDGAACGSFSAAGSVAQSGDVIRIKAGTYSPQSVGNSSKVLIYIGEDGARIDSGSAHNQGLSFSGNATVDNVNVGGVTPFVYFGGANNTWKNSTFLAGTGFRSCANNDAEPILIYSDGPMVSNTSLVNVVIEAQKGAPASSSGCGGDVYHLEQIRIDQNVNGVLLDRVIFKRCPDGSGYAGCGSGQLFITTPNTSTYDPTNIVIRNSVFEGGPNYAVQIHNNVNCNNYTFAYNTLAQEVMFDGCASRSNFLVVGNLGSRPQNCHSGITWTKNVWQWPSGNACGTDTRITGNAYELSALKVNSDWTLASGSPAIDNAEGNTSIDYCTGSLGSIDRGGAARPQGTACDAGANEYGSGASMTAPQAATAVKVIRGLP